MTPAKATRRTGYVALCVAPALIAPVAGARPLRVPILHESLGLLLFGLMAVASWLLVRPTPEGRSPVDGRLRGAGMLLLAPWALIALFWVGLGTPWDATPIENRMRYAVLLAGATGVTAGCVLLSGALEESGERVYSALALAMSVLSGAAYVVWTSFQLGDFALRIATGALDPAVASMNNVFDALLFAGSALAYVATAALAQALGRAGWLGPTATRTYVGLNVLALTLLLLRGVSFPVPGGDPAPWYTRPGFIVGVPAMPWLMPYFLGALVLWRGGMGAAAAGEKSSVADHLDLQAP